MSSPESGGRDDDGPAAVGLTRSSVWRRTVAAASLIGTGVVTKLLGDMMVKSLTEDSFLATVGRALSGLWLGLAAVAAVFALYRWIGGRREQRRAAREVELLEQLVPPGPNMATLAPSCSHAGPGPVLNGLSASNREVARALAALPFEEYDSAALLAVVAGVAEISMKTPGERYSTEPAAAGRLLRKLTEANVVHLGGRQGYCVDRVRLANAVGPPEPPGVVEDSPAWRVTISVLLHHWSDLAGLWALGLNHQELAAGARRWFEYRQKYLYALVKESVRAEDKVPRDAVPAVARLVDALDVWNAVLGQPSYVAAPNGWVAGKLAEKRLAWMRAGRLNERPRYRSRFTVSSGWRARELHNQALNELRESARRPWATARFDSVVRKLTRVWWRLPRSDLAGEVCTAINLAITHIFQSRFDAAEDRLGLAESLAERGDPGGLAHTYEIRGCLCWARGEPAQALSWWMRAFEAYQPLSDDLGASRCLAHMSEVLKMVPQYAGVVWDADRDGDPTEERVRAKVQAWEDEARDLRQAVAALAAAEP
ncbi:tetratricopeptide repeat protein [Nocardia sp. XZ_19_385]|uniref:tetratricopeptide repeat protein n=1 Tax=Nocardia sp. XZ_19_385 TaxID=2769488 RepID=UPI00188F7A2E|nr:tetratricopeptide repeat protein [Nocardia sp. XZ_19_385]